MSEKTKHSPTSSSNMHRRMRCPGSHAAELGLTDEDSEVSQMGTQLHAIYTGYLTGQNVAKEMGQLSTADLQAVNAAIELTEEVINTVTTQRGISTTAKKEIFAERELYFRKGLKILFTGHCDIGVWFEGLKTLIIVDAKFGFNPVEPASGNMQTRCYAVQAFADYPEAEEIIVALVQPRQPRDEQMSIASYLPADLEASRQQILEVWADIQNPDAQRCAGDWCNYCKAKLACEVYTDQLSAIQTFGKATDVSKVSDTDMATLFMAVKLAESEPFSKSVKEEIKKRIQEGRYQGQFELKAGKSRRFITCTSKAFDFLRDHLTPDQIMEAAKFSLTSIGKVFYTASKAAGAKITQKEADIEVSKILAQVIDKTTDAPSIVAIKTKGLK